jgi:hypothetical protein|tara:strand:+ start:4847 stop:5146 length:300 start_codon:yes stop_codon:yes gene_type:complete
MPSKTIETVQKLLESDLIGLTEAEQAYGNSWKKRGGIGAFMMLARKWDRIENQVKTHDYDVLKALQADGSETGILDDIRDLRRYLLLVESEIVIWKNQT